jgi:two-component system chemotaxis sensor kinase CheA
VAALRAHAAQEFGGGDAAPVQTRGAVDPAADGRAFFLAMAELYPLIAEQGTRMSGDAPCTVAERRDLAERIADQAAPRGFVRVVDSALRLSQEPAGHAYRAAELALYEELVSVERSLPASVFDAEMMAPSQILGAWCADHIFETLQSLRKGLEARGAEAGANWFPAFDTLMRQVHFACLNYRIDTASQLTMALIDLFARVRIDQKAPDVILLQMGRGFVDTMELVFDALDQGDTPDTSRIEKMFEEATNACFVASGVMTAKSIETRLGLPPEFHRVMSPESVKTAHEAIREGLHFYVLRADLNDDDALAQGFLEWITTGVVRMITNVTVFLDKATLFDFLVASTLEEDRMVERLAMLDPSGARLMMAQALRVREAPEVEAAEPDSLDLIPMSEVGDSLALLEAVGAISASHAQLEHELTQLASVDLVQDVLEALRAAGVGELEQRVRSVLRDRLEQHNLRLQEISESGAQLSAELSHLQQESVAQRSRPAEVLLRPLKAYVATRARKIGVDASVTYVGGDVMLDQMLIEELRGPLKTLVNLRLAGEYPASRFHISVEAESDHVRVELTDNSPEPAMDPAYGALADEMARKKGALRRVSLPAGAGVRFHLRVPQHMIVLDGMVVRVGHVRYVLPVDAIHRILQTDRLLPVSASGATRMLHIDEGALVPVHPLMPEPAASSGGARLYVVLSSNETRIAIPVDELLGQQLVMLRPLQGVLSGMRDMSGIAILSGGEVGMVVAVSALASGDARKASVAA